MNESSNLSGVLDNNTYNNSNSTNVNSTDCEDCLVDIRKLNNVVPLLYFRIIIIAVISVCILLQLATAVLIKIFKPIDNYIRSYNRLLKMMISDSIYELQFQQTLVILSYFDAKMTVDFFKIVSIPRTYIFVDYLSNIFPKDVEFTAFPERFKNVFLEGFFSNIVTSFLVFVVGFLFTIFLSVFLIARRKREKDALLKKETIVERSENKIENNKEAINQLRDLHMGNLEKREKHMAREIEKLKKEYNIQKYQKFTLEAILNYFTVNFFIRLYQVSNIKTTFTVFLILSFKPTINALDLVLMYLALVIWIIGFPAVLFTHLRKKQTNLMAPQFIIKYGAWYLSYRSITKDVFAFVMIIKFSMVPLILITMWGFVKMQLMLLIILYIASVCFVTIFMPFAKVTKVFTEALSEGILLILFILGLVIEYVESLHDHKIVRWVVLVLLLLIYIIRAYRIIYDFVFRFIDLLKIKDVKEAKFRKNLELVKKKETSKVKKFIEAKKNFTLDPIQNEPFEEKKESVKEENVLDIDSNEVSNLSNSKIFKRSNDEESEEYDEESNKQSSRNDARFQSYLRDEKSENPLNPVIRNSENQDENITPSNPRRKFKTFKVNKQ